MKRSSLLLIAGVSLTLFASEARGSTHPHYGGSLRVQSRDSVTSMDNLWAAPNSVLKQQLAFLLFDRLTRLDDAGSAKPSLAVSWKADPQQRVWEFEIRPNVLLSDDSELAVQAIAAALTKASPQWKITFPNAHAVSIE